MSNFHPLDVVGWFSETQLQVNANLNLGTTQLTRDIEPVLGECWPAVYMTQHWFRVSCLLGKRFNPYSAGIDF